ncbi:MAG: hypothetical protein A2V59_12235 [Armatimonadetes bacterium RBG_19FT_COMBO_69_19]|nr:MAG: hypothetical protein A2V59_12235 [Armatimonadetes bacterium RBG_19FT_COMBO_69_19]
MPEVLIAGEALVEIMRPEVGQPLDEPGPFEGPFPSGAPAICADAVGRMGRFAGFISAVGADDFGRCIVRRLAASGVDLTYVRAVPQTTAMAFITYRADGSRQFLFHLRGSAAEALDPDAVDARYLQGVAYLHLSGSTLAISAGVRAACLRLVDRVRALGGRLSFDPNFRPELLPIEVACAAFTPFVERAAILFPSGQEACWMTGASSPEVGCRMLLERGPAIVALKRGAQGATAFTPAGMVHVPGELVDEVDPTGAGDCFAAAMLVALLEGADTEQALTMANAAGALAVTRRGPMEGTPTRQTLREFLARGSVRTLQSRRRGS